MTFEAERVVIDERIARLEAELAEFAAAAESANLDDEHDPEGATVAFERAQVAALLADARQARRELDAAETRIGAGAYGRCEQCGAPIGAERLAARPATRRCIDCERTVTRYSR